MHDATGSPPPLTLEFEGVDELTSQVFHALRRAIQLQRQLVMKTLSQQGGHHGEAFCLRILVENDGISQRDLAEVLHLSRPRVTKLLQALETAGAVARRADERDRRLTRVFLTPDGRRREGELHAKWADHINLTIGVLSEADRRELRRLLDEVSDHSARLLGDAEAPHTAPVEASAASAAPGAAPVEASAAPGVAPVEAPPAALATRPAPASGEEPAR
ncbi:MAG: MarR family winged helix-turn-helix transcriptional regulator [Actinobacteria bacterium]|nr:MarR family winged helix-turn-helix transcriptional regulator [Actinomycetota bacterium]